jgi:general secretion pathway protein G
MLGACGPGEDPARAVFDAASARIREGDYSGGAALLQQLMDEYPDSPIAATVREDWGYYEELLRIERQRLPGVAADDLIRIGRALEAHRSRRGSYPRDLAALVPAHIDAIPPDPWGRDYLYRRQAGSYVLETRGRDGEPGGDGEDADIQVMQGRLRNAPPRLATRR